jgi:chaperonin GroES
LIKELIQPTFDRVLIRRLAAPTESEGIIIPEGAKEPQSEGTIVAIGPLVITREAEDASVRAFLDDGGEDAQFMRHQTFNVGDRVGFGKYAGTEVVINRDEVFVLMKQDEIQHKVVSVEVGCSAAEQAASEPVADADDDPESY